MYQREQFCIEHWVGVAEGVDRTIRRQHGVITRAQALELGMSRSQIESKTTSGSWLALTAGVYAPASSVPTWHRQLNAAVLSHPNCLVAGMSAAYLLGFPNIRRGRPEIMMPFAGNGRSTVARVIRSRHFDLVDRRMVDGYLCTSPAETALTLSLRWPYAKIERFVDDGLVARVVKATDFFPIFERLAFARQPGLRELRSVVAVRTSDAYQPPVSELERLLFRVLDRLEVPPYGRQIPMSYPAVGATVDAFIDNWQVIVEADGRRWHSRQADFDRDRERDNAAAAAGFIVVRFTWKMLRFEPARCLQTLLEVGEQRSTT